MPTTTPGGKALKFYCSVRCRIARVGGSQEKIKVGGEDRVIGHTIRATVVKNKVAPPFGKAEFKIYYDGRKADKADELADVAILRGIIPKFDAQGNPSTTGRTYLWPTEPAFKATKKADVAVELRKFPKVQEEVLQAIKDGVTGDATIMDSDLDDSDFEEKLKNGELNDPTSEAEETSWDDI